MIRIIKCVDNYLINSVQNSYLWFWDRTGVTVGMVVFFVMSLSVWITTSPIPMKIFFIAWLMVLSFGMHRSQIHSAKRYNLFPHTWRRSILRFLSLVFTFTVMVVNVDIASCLSIVGSYVMSSYIRDREPPNKLQTESAMS